MTDRYLSPHTYLPIKRCIPANKSLRYKHLGAFHFHFRYFCGLRYINLFAESVLFCNCVRTYRLRGHIFYHVQVQTCKKWLLTVNWLNSYPNIVIVSMFGKCGLRKESWKMFFFSFSRLREDCFCVCEAAISVLKQGKNMQSSRFPSVIITSRFRYT